MTQEEKARKYDEAIKRANEYHFDGVKQCIADTLEYIFPELKESEDELTWLTKYIEEEAYSLSIDIRDNEDRIKLKKLQKALAWLEKQGEQNLVDKIVPKFKVGDTITYIGDHKELVADNKYTIKEISKNCYISTLGNKIPFSMQEYYIVVNDPKFKVGDWIVKKGHVYGGVPVMIKEMGNYLYLCERQDGVIIELNKDCVLKEYKHWDITDAVNGNVLVYNKTKSPFIYDGKIKNYDTGNPKDIFIGAHCGIYGKGEFIINHVEYWIDNDVQPATKEQRDLLFSKMEKAGYEWDWWKKRIKYVDNKYIRYEDKVYNRQEQLFKRHKEK